MQAKRILVIDDEPQLGTIIRACLEMLGGWTVLLAESGNEGFYKAEMELPDAILLDVMMPGMDGLTLFRKLQENPATQSIPVILLTAKVQAAEEQSQLSQLGIAGVIGKPFEPLVLTEQITKLLGW